MNWIIFQEGLEGEDEGKGRKEGDDLDLALSALRDCDTDFSKFLPVTNQMNKQFLQVSTGNQPNEQTTNYQTHSQAHHNPPIKHFLKIFK